MQQNQVYLVLRKVFEKFKKVYNKKIISKFFLEDIKLNFDNFKDIKDYKKLRVEKGEINICTKFMNLINFGF